MRIVQTATAYYPSVGGAQLHWFTIARLLRDKGHQLAAITQWSDQRNRYLLDSTVFAPRATMTMRPTGFRFIDFNRAYLPDAGWRRCCPAAFLCRKCAFRR